MMYFLAKQCSPSEVVNLNNPFVIAVRSKFSMCVVIEIMLIFAHQDLVYSCECVTIDIEKVKYDQVYYLYYQLPSCLKVGPPQSSDQRDLKTCISSVVED